ncbi:helix-turn-helix transcriptional regulator [Bacillus pumilus]|jgi:transcriptional regulator with XRE-family HTH domain|uniref:helix-turn-helix domain-containing protein n=1 Tax=Bacillus TaxID=1386 RepID=UPI00068324CD|nr:MULTISPECIES: helix-turn-helix transcriptional regulator [Bacillus]KMY20546.1 XRE family transcriptional regulator [Bacillus pumilus]MCI4617577.1 helix-turn-helix domain-containing protein [Bacillus pumilus]MCM3149696.1 helix-turn-helix domain-containing protein [Bacillus pumilus]MCP1528932.1 transcriptional regulator with XRE-family HTH domain [Bacillus pumilus]MCY7436156.1 helix-turn-helix domain-containing protein [Bacillus pumilus]
MDNLTGKILTELREKHGWSKSTVAKKLGLKAMSTYANWEYGLRKPDGEMIVKIAELYGVSTDYLLTGKDKGGTDGDLADDPDLQIAFKAASDFSEEARRQTIDFIHYIKEKEKQKGRQPKQRDDD